MIDFFGQVRYPRWNRHDREMFKAILREMSGAVVSNHRPPPDTRSKNTTLAGSVDDPPFMEMVTRFTASNYGVTTKQTRRWSTCGMDVASAIDVARARVGFAAQKNSCDSFR